MEWLVLLIGLAVLAGGAYYVAKKRGSKKPAPTGQPKPVEVLAEEELDLPPEPIDRSGVEPTLTPVEPAETPLPRMMVNGIVAVEGAMYVDVDKLPSRFEVEVIDVPHRKEEARARAAGRLNFGGASTGFGNGQVDIKIGEHTVAYAHGSEEYYLSAKVPVGEPVDGKGTFKMEEQSGRRITWFTTPSRRSTPNDRVDREVNVKQTIFVREIAGGRDTSARVHFNFIPADSGREGAFPIVAIVFREPRP